MDYQILTFVLLAVGFVLLAVELLLPTGGIVGVLCAASFLASAYFANLAWAKSNPLYWRIYVVTFVALIPITLSGIHYLLTRTAFGNRVLLAAPSTEEVTPYQREQEHLQGLIGRHGTAISPLRPGGLVQVDRERLHAIGDGFIIESGTPVEVIDIRGTRVVVRPLAISEKGQEAAELDEEVEAEATPSVASDTKKQDPYEILDPFANSDPSE